MADGGDERESPPSGRPGPARLGRRAGGVTRSIWLLEHAQDVLTVGIGVVLLALAAVILVSGVAEFVHSLSVARVLSAQSITAAAVALLDEVLLVLILIEILHTVVLSLRSHRLIAQPFIVVGLVAVIREILFVLTGEKQLGTSVLALLIAMVAVFVTGLVVVSRFERSVEPDLAGRRRVGQNPLLGQRSSLKRLCEWSEVRNAAFGRSEATTANNTGQREHHGSCTCSVLQKNRYYARPACPGEWLTDASRPHARPWPPAPRTPPGWPP